MKKIMTLFALLALGLSASNGFAQNYPNRPITIIVPLAAGGGVDIVTRTVAKQLTAQISQPVVVDNRPGAATNIGSTLAARADPDGYTLLMASNANSINGSLYPDLGYDVLKDFEPIGQIAYAPAVLVVNPNLPVRTVKELVAHSKSHPGQLNYASSGSGSTQHFAGELLRSTTGIDAVHISYKGGAPALTDILAGHVNFMFNNTLEVLPHVKAERLRALAVTSDERTSILPDTPTFKESGYPQFQIVSWWGLLAPKGTSKDIVAFLNEEMVKAMRTAEVTNRFKEMGATVVANSPDDFSRFLTSEVNKWATVAKEAGIQAAN